MIIRFTSLMLWILAGASFLRLFRNAKLPAERPRLTVSLAAIVLVLSGVFLFRPHEDIFGGEDPGSYLNSSVTYERHGSLFHMDPLLSQVPVEDRPDFLYGHAGFHNTKDACLWVRDMNKATIGPWFLPAYPILMSIVARIRPHLILYVVPLFALLTALVLGLLAVRLTGRLAGAPLVFLLYLLNPVTAWNARCPRPEIVASFFFFLGWALLVGAWKDGRRAAFLDVLLAAVCLSVAPFFHITAFFGVLPSLACILVLAALGRKEFFLCLPVGMIGLLGFMCYTRYATDPYLIGKYFEWFGSWPAWLLTGMVVGLFLACGLYFGLSRKPESASPSGRVVPRAFELPFSARVVLMLLVAGSVLFLFFFRPAGGQPAFLPREGGFLILTDFRGVVRLVSRLQAMAALLGLAVLILRRDDVAPSRLLLLGALLPGLFFIGGMDNYMMETRRLMLFVVPLMSLSLGALVLFLAAGAGRWRSAVILGCAGALIAAAVHGRSHLYAGVEYSGFHRFIEPFAETIARQNGNLLAEYSRIAAPFEHFFGIRTLSLDNQQKTDYRAAELAWRNDVMAKEPDRKAFFLTPFQPPVSELFDFIPVQEATYSGSRLSGQRDWIPPSFRDYSMHLRLYEMRLLNGQSDTSAFFANGTYCRRFDLGNMGLRRFANVEKKPWSARGRRLGKGQPLELNLSQPANGEPVKEVLFFLNLPAEETPPGWAGIEVNFEKSGKATVRCLQIEKAWWIARASVPPEAAECRFTVSSEQPALLCQVKMRSAHATKEVEMPGEGFEDEPMASFEARWARDKAQILVPVDRESPLELFLFLRGTETSQGHPLSVRMPSGSSETMEVAPDGWRWQVLTVNPDPHELGRGWVTLTTEEPWKPKRGNSPPDLAVLVGHVVALPPKP